MQFRRVYRVLLRTERILQTNVRISHPYFTNICHMRVVYDRYSGDMPYIRTIYGGYSDDPVRGYFVCSSNRSDHELASLGMRIRKKY
jgi:hypothetical protein